MTCSAREVKRSSPMLHCWPVRLTATFALLLSCGLSGCDSATPPTPPAPKSSVRPGVMTEATGGPGQESPRFEGLVDLLAGEDSLFLRWHVAKDEKDPASEIHYRIYLANESRRQNFSYPKITTRPGELQAVVSGLAQGQIVYVVVRAVDRDGNEDGNKVEWPATPNPVRYVNAHASGGDGLSHESPHPTLESAVGSAIAMPGVNFYLAGGDYPGKVVLFGGMMIYGGFDESFAPASRDPEQNPTRFQAETRDDLVLIAPGKRLVGLDGVRLSGQKRGARGIVAEECNLRLTNIEVQGFTRQGIRLRSDDDPDSRLVGFIAGSTVSQNQSEGLLITGTVDLKIVACTFEDNSQEGIEASPITVATREKLRLEVDRCVIRGNGDLGLTIEIGEFPKQKSQNGRVRISLTGNIIEENRNLGISLDIQYQEESHIDLRAKILQNRIAGNHRAGLHIDGDASADFRIAHNEIVGNGESAGIWITGESPYPFYHVHHNLIAENQGAGVRLDGLGSALLDYNEIRGNLGPAILAPSAWVSISGSIIAGNQGRFDANRIAYSLLRGDQPVVRAQMESCVIGSTDAKNDQGQDAGDPLEHDVDGSRADLGIAGGAYGGSAGPSGLTTSSKLLDLVSVTPPPGSYISDASWTLHFDASVDATRPLRVLHAGEPIQIKVRSSGERSLYLEAPEPLPPGTRLTVELLPFAGGDGTPRQARHFLFDYVLAASLPAPGKVISTLPAVAEKRRLKAADSSHRYRIRFPEGGTLRAEIYARRLDSPRGALLTLYSASGTDILVRSGEDGSEDPVLGPISMEPGAEVVLEVKPASAGSEDLHYRLVLTP